MRDSVPSTRYSSVCNVLRLWNISLIPTYRFYRLYDIYQRNAPANSIERGSLKLAPIMMRDGCGEDTYLLLCGDPAGEH